MANLEDFPLSNLAADLHNKWQMEPMITTHFSMWGYLIIIMSVFTILCILAICLWKYKLKI